MQATFSETKVREHLRKLIAHRVIAAFPLVEIRLLIDFAMISSAIWH